ncbi:uncharacterized protein [Lolium perenne]|uniref:uncharacterized protein n=1 Tax=Lolium perenne TaxID=4522 RepID=UPI003A99F806
MDYLQRPASGAKLMFICPVLGYIKKWIPVLGVSRIPAAAAMAMVSTPLMLSFSKGWSSAWEVDVLRMTGHGSGPPPHGLSLQRKGFSAVADRERMPSGSAYGIWSVAPL